MAALLTKVAGNTQPFVAVVFNRLDLIQAHGHLLSETLVDLRFARCRAGGLGLGQEVLRNLLELVDRVGKTAGFHECRQRPS